MQTSKDIKFDDENSFIINHDMLKDTFKKENEKNNGNNNIFKYLEFKDEKNYQKNLWSELSNFSQNFFRLLKINN